MPTNQPIEPLEIPRSRGELFLAAAASTAFVAFGFYLIGIGLTEAEADWVAVAFGGVTIAFFGFTGLIAGARLFDRAPAVRLDQKGLHLHPGNRRPVIIPWSEINGFDIATFRGQKFVTIDTANPDDHLVNMTTIQRWTVRLNGAMFECPIYITTQGTATNASSLLVELRRFHDRMGPGGER